MEKLLKRSTDRGPMRGRESSLDAKLTTVGLLRIRIKEATNVKTTGKHRSLYCQFTCGTQKVYSRLMSPKPAPGGGANQNEELQSTLYFDETLNILIEQRAMELQIVVFQPHSLDVDKLIGHDVVRLSDCKELETTEFCVKLTKPKNAQLTFEASYFGLLTEEETKEYGEYLYVLSEETFVDLFKKDRLGFSLSEAELKDYSSYTRSKKENPLVRSFGKKKWQHWKTSKELKQMGRKGLPLSHRAEVWLTSSRAKERKAENKGMYWTILEVHKDEHSPHQAQILKDLDRTFPGHRVYLDKRGLLPLQRVLMAYAWKNSSIGYCQSMNFITAFLLLFMDEESAFWLLSAIVEELVPDYYAPIMIGAKADQIVFCQLVEKKLPAIHAHLTKLNVPYQQASMQWFLSLFIDQLPTETTLRVLDAFFCEGSMVLMRVGLAILKMKEKQILATPDFESCWMLLKRVTKTIFDADTLMKLAFGELGSFKELKIATRRGHAYRQIEEKGSITTYQGLKKVFRLENGRSLRNLRDSLADHSETPFSFRVELATLTEHLLKINSNLDHADIKAVFKILDQDLKGTIDFYDLICALSLVFNGVPVEKMMVCFQMLDTDLDGKLDVREMQHLLSMHYKWLRRTLKTGRDWQVDAIVQHDIDLLSKKTRPYLEEKGGKVDYVEFRFKIAPELEALEAWLRSEPREVGPVRRTAAQILEEEKEKEKEKENSRENGKGKEKEKEKERENKGTRVNILLSSVDLDARPTSSCDESGRGDGLKGRRSNSSDSLHELMLKVQGNRISRDEKKSPRKTKTKKEKSPSKKRWSTKKNRKYKTYKEEVIREFKDKPKDWDPTAQDPWKKGDGKDGLVADDVKQSDD